MIGCIVASSAMAEVRRLVGVCWYQRKGFELLYLPSGKSTLPSRSLLSVTAFIAENDCMFTGLARVRTQTGRFSLIMHNKEINHYTVKRSLQIQPILLNSQKLISRWFTELIHHQNSFCFGTGLFQTLLNTAMLSLLMPRPTSGNSEELGEDIDDFFQQ